MRRLPGLVVLALLACGRTASFAHAADNEAEQVRFFETSIRPVLAEHCFKCHGNEKTWANLRLDLRADALRGGDTGPAIVPGKPNESLLIKAIRQTDENLQMPPDGKLTERQISDFTKWIEQGAVYPAPVITTKKAFRNPKHWAFQPPAEPNVPAVRNTGWVQTGLDAFLLARMEAANVTPTAAADRLTLIRRITFDLTGLPPTPEEVAEFVADERPEAVVRLVDRLLGSPAYGERWGRHWLDIARYADSNGLDENVAYGNAWRYRDYVVRSFNEDKPYSQFLRQQLAGDLLDDSEGTREERLVATGFLSLGAKVLAEVDETKMEMDIVDEQIDTLGRALLGMTFGCSRCHDHKFDAINTTDYYALAGIFKSTKTMDSFTKVAKWHENPLPDAAAEARKAAHDAQVAEKKKAVSEATERANAAARAALKPGEPAPASLEPHYSAEAKAEIKKLKDELTALEKSAPEIPSAMGVTDGKPLDVAVHVRGSHLKLGDLVPRSVPAVMASVASTKFPADQSGRRELADWIASPNHPLTARVLVNRVWRWHFGQGIVRTTDNFGQLGAAPSHPELLDWLAVQFVRQGSSLKWLHRQILLSSAYQQGSAPTAETRERDPENRLFSRFEIRRLEAEAIRDALLSVGGQLDRTFGGSLLQVPNRGYLFDHTSKDMTTYDSVRRSLYLPIIRNNTYDIFQLLDFPDAAVPNGNRDSTTVAPQALLMMNSELVLKASEDLAGRLLEEIPSGPADGERRRIARLYQLAYGRDASPMEVDEGLSLMRELQTDPAMASGEESQRTRRIWACLCQVVLAANEFIYLR